MIYKPTTSTFSNDSISKFQTLESIGLVIDALVADRDFQFYKSELSSDLSAVQNASSDPQDYSKSKEVVKNLDGADFEREIKNQIIDGGSAIREGLRKISLKNYSEGLTPEGRVYFSIDEWVDSVRTEWNLDPVTKERGTIRIENRKISRKTRFVFFQSGEGNIMQVASFRLGEGAERLTTRGYFRLNGANLILASQSGISGYPISETQKLPGFSQALRVLGEDELTTTAATFVNRSLKPDATFEAFGEWDAVTSLRKNRSFDQKGSSQPLVRTEVKKESSTSALLLAQDGKAASAVKMTSAAEVITDGSARNLPLEQTSELNVKADDQGDLQLSGILRGIKGNEGHVGFAIARQHLHPEPIDDVQLAFDAANLTLGEFSERLAKIYTGKSFVELSKDFQKRATDLFGIEFVAKSQRPGSYRLVIETSSSITYHAEVFISDTMSRIAVPLSRFKPVVRGRVRDDLPPLVGGAKSLDSLILKSIAIEARRDIFPEGRMSNDPLPFSLKIKSAEFSFGFIAPRE